ncbi:MAG: UDP-3-O-acyl-N-acetylglucosamine deacetylase, partial [Phycisphaerales bacterium]
MTGPLSPSRSIGAAARLAGVGLFTGAPCVVTIAPPLTGLRGLVFQRTDLSGSAGGLIPAATARVITRPRQTVLVAEGGAGV